MSEIDYEKFSQMVAEKLAPKVVRKLTLSTPEVHVYMGFAPYSSAAREIMKDPKFPKPDFFTENGHARYYTKDIDAYMDMKRQERSKMSISVA